MRTVHRLRLAAAVLTLTGAIVGSFVWGDGSAKRTPLQPPSGKKDAPDFRLGDGLAGGKFADQFPTRQLSWRGSISCNELPEPLALVGQGAVLAYSTLATMELLAVGCNSDKVSPSVCRTPL